MDKELYELLKQKRKVEAVKYIRNKYDMDFKSAKETVDKLIEKVEYFDEKNLELSEEDLLYKNRSLEESEISDDDLYALVKENRKVDAIKYVREKYNFDLKISKNIVDSLDINDPKTFTEKNIISASKSINSNYGNDYTSEGYSYEMRNGEQHYYVYKDGEKREVNRTAIPRDILKGFEQNFEKSSEEYEDRKTKRKNIILGILLIIVIAGILIYFN